MPRSIIPGTALTRGETPHLRLGARQPRRARGGARPRSDCAPRATSPASPARRRTASPHRDTRRHGPPPRPHPPGPRRCRSSAIAFRRDRHRPAADRAPVRWRSRISARPPHHVLPTRRRSRAPGCTGYSRAASTGSWSRRPRHHPTAPVPARVKPSCCREPGPPIRSPFLARQASDAGGRRRTDHSRSRRSAPAASSAPDRR